MVVQQYCNCSHMGKVPGLYLRTSMSTLGTCRYACNPGWLKTACGVKTFLGVPISLCHSVSLNEKVNK